MLNKMLKRKVTYEDYQELSGESNLNLEEILDLFERLNWTKDTFMYFIINEVNTLQIAFRSTDKYLIEILNDSDGMVFPQKYATKQETISQIEYYYGTNEINTNGFYDVPVGNKTLDDIINGN